MSLVALTVGVFAIGGHLGRSLSPNVGFVFFFGALVCLFTMRFAERRSGTSAMGWLFIFGALMGLGVLADRCYTPVRTRKHYGRRAVPRRCS